MQFVQPQKCIVSVRPGDKLEILSADGERDFRVPIYSIFSLLDYIERNAYTNSANYDKSEVEIEDIILNDLEKYRARGEKLVQLSPCASVLSSSHICEPTPLPVRVGYILHVVGVGLVRIALNPDFPMRTNSDYRYTIEKIK